MSTIEKSRARSFFSGLTAWLSLAALAVTVWLLVVVLGLFSASGGSVQGVALLPPTTCANGRTQARPSVVGADALANIRYSVSGCNAQSLTTDDEVEAALASAQTKFLNLGLPAPSEPIEVEVLNTKAALKVFVAPDGGRGALVVAGVPAGLTTTKDEFLLSEGYAQLSLAYAFPHLTAATRARLGVAFTIIAEGVSVFKTVSSELSSGEVSAGEVGVYDAWLSARFGVKTLSSALQGCARSCSWPTQEDAALKAKGENGSALRAQFLGSFSTGVRGSVLAALLQP